VCAIQVLMEDVSVRTTIIKYDWQAYSLDWQYVSVLCENCARLHGCARRAAMKPLRVNTTETTWMYADIINSS